MKIGRGRGTPIPRTGLGLDPVLNPGQLKDAQRQIDSMQKKADSVHKPMNKAVQKKAINHEAASKIEKVIDHKAEAYKNALIGFRGTQDKVRVYGPQDPAKVNAARAEFEKTIESIERRDFQKPLADAKKIEKAEAEDSVEVE